MKPPYVTLLLPTWAGSKCNYAMFNGRIVCKLSARQRATLLWQRWRFPTVCLVVGYDVLPPRFLKVHSPGIEPRLRFSSHIDLQSVLVRRVSETGQHACPESGVISVVTLYRRMDR